MTQVQDLRKCIVCGKRCNPSDKNSDGTYAHADCLRAVSVKWMPS